MLKTYKLRSPTGKVLKRFRAHSPLGAVKKSNRSGIVILTSSTKKGKKLYVYSVDKKKKTISKRAQWFY